jgi:hypothetical protein
MVLPGSTLGDEPVAAESWAILASGRATKQQSKDRVYLMVCFFIFAIFS